MITFKTIVILLVHCMMGYKSIDNKDILFYFILFLIANGCCSLQILKIKITEKCDHSTHKAMNQNQNQKYFI